MLKCCCKAVFSVGCFCGPADEFLLSSLSTLESPLLKEDCFLDSDFLSENFDCELPE